MKQYKSLKKKEYDFTNLLPLATSPKLKEIYDKIVHEDEPDVRDAWLEKFVETTQCPNCSAKLSLNKRTGVVKCDENCGFEIRL